MNHEKNTTTTTNLKIWMQKKKKTNSISMGVNQKHEIHFSIPSYVSQEVRFMIGKEQPKKKNFAKKFWRHMFRSNCIFTELTSVNYFMDNYLLVNYKLRRDTQSTVSDI